jgi:hypothetical protein
LPYSQQKVNKKHFSFQKSSDKPVAAEFMLSTISQEGLFQQFVQIKKGDTS